MEDEEKTTAGSTTSVYSTKVTQQEIKLDDPVADPKNPKVTVLHVKISNCRIKQAHFRLKIRAGQS